MKESIKTIKDMLNSHIEATRNHMENLNRLDADTTYTVEAKANTREKLKKLYMEASTSRRDRILEAIKEMKKKEKTSVDLTDARLSNAVSLIDALGDKTPDKILRDIERQFTGDQASLEVLKGAYEKNGVPTIILAHKAYDVKSTYNELAQGIYDDFKHPETIGGLNRAFNILDNIIGKANETEQEQTEEININVLPQLI